MFAISSLETRINSTDMLMKFISTLDPINVRFALKVTKGKISLKNTNKNILISLYKTMYRGNKSVKA
jgi:hypothetical protein